MLKYFITYLVFCFALPVSVSAASVSIRTTSSAVVGAPLVVDIVADTNGESFNAADVTIVYPGSSLKFRGVKKEDSIISVWITTPHEVTPGTVSFSGVIPGGVERRFDPQHPSDESIVLARLLFVPSTSGTIPLTVEHATLLRNDGTGAPLIPTLGHTSLRATPGGADTTFDTEAPEPFIITLVEKSPFGKTPRLARFESSADDIDQYEMKINNGRWHPVTSPYPLPVRLLSYTLTIRAIDFSGNVRDQSITIPGTQTIVWQTVLSTVTLIVVVLIIYRRRKKSQ